MEIVYLQDEDEYQIVYLQDENYDIMEGDV